MSNIIARFSFEPNEWQAAQSYRMLNALPAIPLLLRLAGCAGPGRLPALPINSAAAAHVLNIPEARFYAAEDSARIADMSTMAIQNRSRLGIQAKELNFLSISGGGEDGAFGAGLLVG